jgi:hypothetical protein
LLKALFPNDSMKTTGAAKPSFVVSVKVPANII